MRLSSRARNALWLMVELARAGDRVTMPLGDVARVTHISRRYLDQLALALRAAGLVRGRSGRAGGYALTRAASEVSLAEIVEAAIGPVNVVECVRVPQVCLRSQTCECRWMYATINERVRGVLDQLTLADLLDEPHPDLRPREVRGCPPASPTATPSPHQEREP